ncbi:MAG: hypothetical protein CVV41_21720 [Candidatus Riflebacteria bacterium HGW-Riflebacteria-1]|jgi:YHS domain-containing protein|nr:MAG: hypothetical protein CVV41_21720 [Candidatus Riflebacteria bacterium HGW-Riflebacteria-1]
MKRNFIGIVVCIMAVIIAVSPAFAQHGARKERTVSPAQKDPAPQTIERIKPTSLIGIPSNLVAVHYRRCPMDGQRLKQGKPVVFEGKVYRFCCDACVERFWEKPEAVALKLKDCEETPLTITNKDGKCLCCEHPASREFSRIYRGSIAFFCSSACRDKDTRGHRTPVSRQQEQMGTKK